MKNNKRNPYYYQHQPISGKLFHAPQASGTIRKIPMTTSMHIISALSLLLQLFLTLFAIYAYRQQLPIAAFSAYGIYDASLYLILPLCTWMLTSGFRLACRIIPLETWRLPQNVRKGMIQCSGTLLKLLTLLVELDTAICFIYISITLYLGHIPSNAFLSIWILLLILSIAFPCQRAIHLADK